MSSLIPWTGTITVPRVRPNEDTGLAPLLSWGNPLSTVSGSPTGNPEDPSCPTMVLSPSSVLGCQQRPATSRPDSAGYVFSPRGGGRLVRDHIHYTLLESCCFSCNGNSLAQSGTRKWSILGRVSEDDLFKAMLWVSSSQYIDQLYIFLLSVAPGNMLLLWPRFRGALVCGDKHAWPFRKITIADSTLEPMTSLATEIWSGFYSGKKKIGFCEAGLKNKSNSSTDFWTFMPLLYQQVHTAQVNIAAWGPT